MAARSPDDLEGERDALLWTVQVSSRYHMRRQAFFERWSRTTAAVGVIFGSSAVGGAMSASTSRWLIGIAGALTAIASTVDLVVGTAVMARRHEDLRKKFIALEADLRSVVTPTANVVAAWYARRLEIEADEPPLYNAIVFLCENELGSATEGVGPRAHISRWVRWTSHLYRWENLVPRAIGQTA